MPSKPGLALLVRLYILRTVIAISGNHRAHIAATGELVPYNLVIDLAYLDCLETRGPKTYTLTPKGVTISSHVSTRQETHAGWGSSAANSYHAHYWREYRVNGAYIEYESACGKPRLQTPIWRELESVQACQKCLDRLREN
jgi:hypothetical protein